MRITASLALVLFIGLVQCSMMVASRGVPGYILTSENNLLKQTPDAVVYGDSHVKELILHNLGMLEASHKASETARDLISKHGNKNLLAIQKLNYAFLLESEPSSVLLNSEKKASSQFKLKHQSALFNVCNGDDSSKCIINHLFNAQDEQSIVSKLKKAVNKSNIEAYLYTDNLKVANTFPKSTLLSAVQESGEVYIVDPQSHTPLKIANSVSGCFNEIIKSKYVFDEKELVIKAQDNLGSAVLIASGAAKNDFVQYMNDICSVVGVSTLIRKDANPSFFAFHLTTIGKLEKVLAESEKTVLYEIFNLAYDQFVKNIMKHYTADEVSGQVLILKPRGGANVPRKTIELPKPLYKNSRILAETTTTVLKDTTSDTTTVIFQSVLVVFVLITAWVCYEMFAIDVQKDSVVYAKFLAADYFRR